ncbi:hypothetical protein ACH35V_06460 [Actinomadura sp. 1N219]|uniref:hypothetical protein n=1 Tax=Actinomadura sp. 1N219 TaxID=3375152 RepID=UPI0037A9EF99
MQPNLIRIPGDGDAHAAEILKRAPAHIDAHFIDALQESDVTSLARYGMRSATFALRSGSVERLRDGLLAHGMAECRRGRDWRDSLVSWAIHFFVAEALGYGAQALFQEVADRLPPGEWPDLLRRFGTRKDVTLRAFGWRLVDADTAPDFVPDAL